MEPNQNNDLARLEEKIDAIYESMEKMKRNAQIVMWVTIALIVLPALGLVFIIPAFINSYTTALEGLI